MRSRAPHPPHAETAPAIDLPPVPAGFEEAPLAGAPVVAHLTDHAIVEGFLADIGAAGVALKQDGGTRRIPLDELQYLLFVAPIRESATVTAVNCRPFSVRFADNAELSGSAIGIVHDGLGLHVFRCFRDRVRRLFVPEAQLLNEQPEAPEATTGPANTTLELRSNSAVGEWLAAARGDGARGEDVPLVDLDEVILEEAAIAAVPGELARRHSVMPVAIRGQAMAVAMANPANAEAARILGFVSGFRIEPLQASAKAIQNAIHRCYDADEDARLLAELNLLGKAGTGESEASIETLARQKPIVRLVNHFIVDAIHRRASDIHIRPGEESFEVLFRIDGTLVPVRRFTAALLRPIVSRIKVIGGMDIAEQRRPQDGRSSFQTHEVVIDMRISVIPTVSGESVVIRLLNAREGIRTLDELGLLADDETRLRDALSKNFGMVLVTGPTGSGKSTTLYAALLEMRRRNVNIITVEDPVEYFLDDVEQIQVNAAIGFTFARALRNILRHDPDVVMVGEIRDRETAEIAVESALTGHLILSTLHTNDAATSVTRLLDLGIQPFLLKSTLLAILAQRLVKKNCPHCLVEEHVEPWVRRSLGVDDTETFYVGAGCDHCDGLGHYGRTAVYELLIVTPGLRRLIAADADADALRKHAIGDGMITLTGNALTAARDRITSLAEVFRIRMDD